MDVKSEIKKVLEADGGWLSRNALLNRIEDVEGSALAYQVTKMTDAGELLRINGVNGFEYALPGTRIPNAEGTGSLRRLEASDVAPETLAARPRGTALETIRTRAAVAPAPSAASYNGGQFPSAKEKARAAVTAPAAATPAPQESAPEVVPEPVDSTRGARAGVGITFRQVYEYLAQHPGANDKQIARALDLTTPTASYHRKRVRDGIRPEGITIAPPSLKLDQPSEKARFALWSTGEFVIVRGAERIVLEKDETHSMFAYVDGLRGDLAVSA